MTAKTADVVPPAPNKRTAHAQLFHLAGKHQELKERGVRVVLKAPVAPDPRLHPIVEAVGRWCQQGLRGHFQVAEVVGTMSSTRILVFVRLGKYVSCRDGLIDRGRRPLCDTQIHIPRFGAVRAAASCDSLTPPTRVRGTTRTGPLGSSDGRQSPSIAAPKAMPFAGASSHPVVASECIPVCRAVRTW